ncbi:type II toxin-antitoxin system ParD family antitoxin [Caulobacter sp. S45]|uniref:type II toxin-antitoxin system ParD family antitoxin n=1 Tax=Caulobacter sp. S45 TaxID=1641861 RepID=UPI00131C7DF8|nr:type II toxin-antitoxin system ParD family antitoxin [Caulobacter sp. S45]
MATRNVNLTEGLDHFVEERVASGDFQNASEVVRAGLRLLKTRTDTDAARLARLRAAVQVGLDQLERGEGIEVEDIGAWLDELQAEVEAEFQ